MNLAQGVQFVSFAILAVMMIGSALGVVLLNNIVYSAFLLGGVLVSMSGFYLLLNADFIAAAQILVYVGAVNVLILFAIMLVNKREDFAPIKNRWIRTASTALVCAGLFALLGTMILATSWPVQTDPSLIPASSVVELGKHFFTDFLLPFELASVLLLMAMIGAIILARRDFLPDLLVSKNREIETSLTLPERPRELASIGGDSTTVNR
ncbi:NADH-quinone oxidoreductase subunit J [Limnofasciculus baicalensis]|uniref:NADH-quinone oxidoreductase subunit J n=1 Tax=Limnofasciculus baicalensis BBK-W-15 TaxID=2699891 RepID=A0AAE3GP84_9CYAN|nr:NADH-quinone oxidoreductase subunit J [Limnofasciculus baicalensis]MCP2727614.1 NADH-quinone oxidoreductase subunit J [Limnofasciculus baicalensis BBK-W-15]